MNVSLDGVTIDNTIGSLSRLAEAIWIVDAVKRHEGGQRCLELFKPYCIGKQILESDRTVFLTFATPWDLLNFWRACGTGFDVQISGDVTSKASTTALNNNSSRGNKSWETGEWSVLSVYYPLIDANCYSSRWV